MKDWGYNWQVIEILIFVVVVYFLIALAGSVLDKKTDEYRESKTQPVQLQPELKCDMALGGSMLLCEQTYPPTQTT